MSRVSGHFPVQLATGLPDWSAGGRVVLQSPQSRHARLVADILARMSRGCYEETPSVENLSLMAYTVKKISTARGGGLQYSVDLRIQTYTEAVPLTYGKLAVDILYSV